jgi:hypothetical protein
MFFSRVRLLILLIEFLLICNLIMLYFISLVTDRLPIRFLLQANLFEEIGKNMDIIIKVFI